MLFKSYNGTLLFRNMLSVCVLCEIWMIVAGRKGRWPVWLVQLFSISCPTCGISCPLCLPRFFSEFRNTHFGGKERNVE